MAFTVAGHNSQGLERAARGDISTVTDDFLSKSKNLAFHTVIYTDIIWTVIFDYLLTVFNHEVALQLRHYDWLIDWLRIEGILKFVLTER